MEQYVSGKKAMEILGVSAPTLHRYDKLGKIDTFRTPGNKRMYNVNKFLNLVKPEQKDKPVEPKMKICYCRVSTSEQRENLDKQIKYMEEKYPDYEIISDIGSGLNFKRDGLRKIIKLAIENKVDKVVVVYKDRLCRFGFDLIQHILEEYSSAQILIDNVEELSPQEELVKDILYIMNIFTAKINGMRKYGNKKEID